MTADMKVRLGQLAILVGMAVAGLALGLLAR